MIYKQLNIFTNLLNIYSVCYFLKTVQGNYLEDNYPKSVIEDAMLDTTQLIRKYQYPLETHYVTTKDNYILQLHRIPKPKAPPVLLMHGLEDSSAAWILMGPTKAPAYYLHDNGYDVWMGNARGNRYSRNHTTLNPDKDSKFWNFSWHEIGFFDLPAMIDYILLQTGYRKIGYFGHSQGTTSFFVLCSMRPNYNNKITMMHALAPVAYMGYIKSPYIGVGLSVAAVVKKYTRITELLHHPDMLPQICFNSKATAEFCIGIYYQLYGRDVEQTNATRFPTIFGHLPAGASFKQADHFSQLVISNRFCQYDYGLKENLKRYGKPKPPDYPLEKITAPVGLYYASNDYLSSEIDVKRLSKMLPNVVEDRLYPYKNWNHLTVLWGIDARTLAHKRMLEIMKKYPYE